MQKSYDITLVGMINLNLALSPVDHGIFDRDVTLIGPVIATPGGDAMNEALTAARLSNRVAIAGKVGDDLFGRHILETARQSGIMTDSIKVDKAAKTAVGAMLIDQSGDRNICAYRGAIESFCLEDVDFNTIEGSRYVNIGSMLALKNLDGAGVCEVLRRAKQSGAVTSADVKQDTYGIGYKGIQACFEYLDYFLPSHDEALYLSGEKDPQRQAAFFLSAGCTGVIIKLGKDGCYLATGNEQTTIGPCPAKRVDTSGAGDNFVAGFLTGLSRGWSAPEAARFGNAVAAISIQEFGSNGAIKSFKQVEEYRKQVHY